MSSSVDALARSVGEALLSAGATVAVAETTAGGLISARLLSVPGASAWFDQGVIVYSRRSKRELTGIDDDLLRREGSVSRTAVSLMARGLQARTGTEHCFVGDRVAIMGQIAEAALRQLLEANGHVEHGRAPVWRNGRLQGSTVACRTRTATTSQHSRSLEPGTAQPVAVDTTKRWTIARRLVTDTSLAPDDRVLGALVVLYAQPLTRISVLTVDDVRCDDDGTVTVTLAGRVRIELPEPFATLARQLPERRRNGVSERLPTRWMFPGATPDRHVHVNTLGNRLRRLDIGPRAMRAAAISQLAAEIPPAILASTIGINATTAAGEVACDNAPSRDARTTPAATVKRATHRCHRTNRVSLQSVAKTT